MSVTIVTNYGKLKVELFCDLVPRPCFNFLANAASDIYNDTLFHRSIKGFMIQGGDPTNTGKGGESIWGGTFKDEFHNDLRHDKRGIVSFANNGPDTNGSQFYITYSAQPHLNNQYTIFGQVIDGLEVLDAMEKVPVGKKNRPLADIKIESIVIHANPLAT
eukprot:gene30593-39862_t